MFHRSQSTLIFLVAFFVALAVAAPGRRTEPTITTTVTHTVTAPASQGTAPTGQCSTGPVQCCNSVQKAGDAKNLKPDALAGIFGGLLSAILGGLVATILTDVSANVPVGLNCSPVLGVLTSTSCSAQAVCCQNNNFNGLVNVGCSPVNIGL